MPPAIIHFYHQKSDYLNEDNSYLHYYCNISVVKYM